MHGRVAFSLFFVILTPSTLQGQSPVSAPHAQPGAGSPVATLEGDVYFVMQSGDLKKGAGRTIYLLRDSQAFTEARSLACAEYQTEFNALTTEQNALNAHLALLDSAGYTLSEDPQEKARVDAMQDKWSVAFAVGELRVRRLIDAAKLREIGTGMNARYVFSNVPAGKYILFGEWKIGDTDYQWWSPIELRAGQRLRRDLDNAVEANNHLFCGIK